MDGLSWDGYFYSVCDAVSYKSPCISRHIGAIAVKNSKYVIATGYNGPPVGFPHCETKDESGLLTCPRRLKGYKSGEGLHLCPAEHAERNVINEAARMGHSLLGCTLYMNCEIPCAECSKAIVNSGIREIVVAIKKCYDPIDRITGVDILQHCGILVRTFKL